MAGKPKVAVIGLGHLGTVVATNLVQGNRPIIVADRKIEKANELVEKLGNLAQSKEIPIAIKEADIVVLAVWFDAMKALFKTYAAELKGKIIVDPSNPIERDENGEFKKIIAKDQSAGEILSSLLPKDAKLAKALGTIGSVSLSKAAFQQPNRAILFYATDDISINSDIEQLIVDTGFEPLRVGGLDQSIRIEAFGDLHEFGGLGKTISSSEAKTKLYPLAK